MVTNPHDGDDYNLATAQNNLSSLTNKKPKKSDFEKVKKATLPHPKKINIFHNSCINSRNSLLCLTSRKSYDRKAQNSGN